MKKLNKKGFFLVETFVVISIVAVVLILFYRQISTMLYNYEESFQYDTVQSIHTANNIKNFVLQENFNDLVTDLGTSKFLDITNYEFSRPNFYTELKNVSNIDKIYLMPFNINDLISNIYSYGFDFLLIDYIKKLRTISTDDTSHLYRIVVALNNDTYSNVIININEDL
jgi:competence protein ComGC